MRTLATEDENSLMLEQGGLILLEGETLDALTTAAALTRNGEDVTLTAAYTDADHLSYTDSTGGSGDLTDGEATLTGMANQNFTVTVTAYDASDNALAQGTGTYIGAPGGLTSLRTRMRRREMYARRLRGGL